MQNKNLCVIMICLSALSFSVQASRPKFTITPVSPGAAVSVLRGDVARVTYNVTNNLPNTKTLTMKPLTAVTQRPRGTGVCSEQFILSPGASCVLTLRVDARQLTAGTTISGGPEICMGSTRLSCAQPSTADLLQISVLAAADATLDLSSFDVVTATTTIGGNARTLTITNNGPSAAQTVTYSVSPALPTGTTITSSPSPCGTLASGASCVLTITPGTNPSSAGAVSPTPSIITILGTNTNTVTAEITVLTYGNLYQGGNVFSIDATTSAGTNVSGKIVAIAGSTGSMAWASALSAVTAQDAGNTNGSANTAAIITALGTNATAPQFCTALSVNDAGTSCTGSSCFTQWYLPAICEMGTGVGITGCTNDNLACSQNNIYTNLVANQVMTDFISNGPYWSSTICDYDAAYPYYQRFQPNFYLNVYYYSNILYVRCARIMT